MPINVFACLGSAVNVKESLVTLVTGAPLALNVIVIYSTPSNSETSVLPRFLNRILNVAVSPFALPSVMEVEKPDGILAGSPDAGVGVAVALGVGVAVALGVGVAVALGVGVAVALGVGVAVAFGVGVAVALGVGVAVALGGGVAVAFGVGVAVAFGVGVAVAFGVGVAVALGVGVAVAFGVGEAVTDTTTAGEAVVSPEADAAVVVSLKLPFASLLPISSFVQKKNAATRRAATVNVIISGPIFFFLRFVLSSRCGIGAA
jgi:hypothetical protein